MNRPVTQQGFSLLEVQLAIGIVALGLALASQFYVNLGQQARLTYERQQATQVLQQLVTILPYYHRHLPQLESLSAGSDTVTMNNCDDGRSCSAEAMLSYHWVSWQVQLKAALGDGRLHFMCQPTCLVGSQLIMQVRWGQTQETTCDHQCVSLQWSI